MKSVYISSTYEDLKQYRLAVAEVLRNCNYNVEQASGAQWLAGEVDRIVSCYSAAISTVFGRSEADIKQIVTPAGLRELGIKPEGEVLERFGTEGRQLLSADLIRRHTPYVVLMRDGNPEGVIDRAELASRIASTALR